MLGCSESDLVSAVELEMLDEVKRLVEKYNISPNCITSNGITPLGRACELYVNLDSHNIKILKYLLNNGADPNKRIEYYGDETPLSLWLDREMSMCFDERDFIVPHLLIEAGTTLNTYIKYGNSTYVLETITPLHKCTDRSLIRSHNIIKFLIDCGANVNLPNNNDITPLIKATLCNRLDMVKFLVESGAFLNMRGCYGKSALDIAISKGHSIIAKYLIEQGPKRSITLSKMIIPKPSIEDKYNYLLSVCGLHDNIVEEACIDNLIKREWA